MGKLREQGIKVKDKIKDFKVSPRESDQSLDTLSKKVNELIGDVYKFMNENAYKEGKFITTTKTRVTRT